MFPLTTHPTVILTTILDRIKWKSKSTAPQSPPPPKFEDEATQYFPILHWGRGGGDKFPISSVQDILSVIVAGL